MKYREYKLELDRLNRELERLEKILEIEKSIMTKLIRAGATCTDCPELLNSEKRAVEILDKKYNTEEAILRLERAYVLNDRSEYERYTNELVSLNID